MFEKILLDSGQFFIDDGNIEINQDKFVIIVRSVLALYSNHYPYDLKFNINIVNKMFEFTETSKTVLGAETNIPSWISDVLPIRISGVYPYQLFMTDPNTELSDKKQYVWEYRKPRLYIPMPGLHEIHAVFKHQIIEESIENKKSYKVDTIDYEDHIFFQLLQAAFLKGIGRSRRAFTLEALPLATDASELIGEAESLEERAREDLEEKHDKWWLAIG